MNIPRLERLETVLRAVAARNDAFDIHSWGDVIGNDYVPKETADPEVHLCGTSACAAGWGALDPELMAQGLRLNYRLVTDDGSYRGKREEGPVNGVRHMNELFARADKESADLSFDLDVQDETGDLDAFFGLETTDWLFMPSAYNGATALKVADRIRALIDSGEDNTKALYRAFLDQSDD